MVSQRPAKASVGESRPAGSIPAPSVTWRRFWRFYRVRGDENGRLFVCPHARHRPGTGCPHLRRIV
jgi:hypothetical protein